MGDCNCKGGTHGGSAVCVECDIPQLARNNYFTGKLLVERDFTDEQHYFMGKERRHNQRLHGWGAVCGLKVSPHPNPTCADRFVLIDPGTAIDCCGREILVRNQECFDFKSRYLENWQAQHGPGSVPDAKPVDIQICVSFKECATEDVPALFDDCASDASSRPNRILESYGFDVLFKSKNSAPEAGGIQLKWLETLNFADAVRVQRHEDTNRVYILTSTASIAVLYALDATTGSIVMPPQTFANNTGLDLAVSPAGDFIYVALLPTAAGAVPAIAVMNQADLSQANTVSIGTVADSQVRIGVVPAPDNRVISIGQASEVLVWPTTINSSAAATPTQVAVNNPGDLAISPNGQFAYVVSSGTNALSAISLAAGLNVTTLTVGNTPIFLAAAATTAGDTLAVLDVSGTPTLYFVGLGAGPSTPKALGQVTGFANTPVDVQMSPGGRWALVLEHDTSGKVYVQPVDEHAVELGSGNVFGNAISVGAGSANESLSGDGTLLYVPYQGNATTPGSVAVVSVEQGNCLDLFKCAIEPCPDCDDGNCIVLATITRYVYGNPVTAAQIDNLTDRHILASTSLLTDVVRCLLDEGPGNGKTGPQGPPGIQGPNGLQGNDGGIGPQGLPGDGIDSVDVTFVPCGTPGSASLSGPSGSRKLTLTIPGECNKDLTGIAGVTWKGNGGSINGYNVLVKDGLGIAFSAPVQAADLADKNLVSHSIFLLVPVKTNGLTTWTEAGIQVKVGDFTLGDPTTPLTPPNATGFVNGLIFRIDGPSYRQIEELKPTEFRVLVKGDFIRDEKNRAVDGDHLPPWLPLPSPQHTGDGIAGGTFESWFVIKG